MLRYLVAGLLVATSCSGRTDPPQALAASAPATAAAPAKKKDPATARQLIAAGAMVLDVRTADEFASGHVATATNIPVDELPRRLDEVAKLTSGDVHRPVVVYCASGHRAASAQKTLDAAGYTQVVNGGGLDDLQ